MTTPAKLHLVSLEENNKAIRAALFEKNEEAQKLDRSVRRISESVFGKGKGFSMNDHDKFPVTTADFSWKKTKAKLEEADAASGFPQLLRAGVQTIMNAAYQTVDISYNKWVKVVNSTKDTELYAPLQGIGFPSEVAKGEKYGEVGAAGLDISITNKKYGEIFSVQKELVEDDQTGQFRQQAGLMGEYLAQVAEVLVMAKVASVPTATADMQYGNMIVPPTETKPTNESSAYPYAPASGPFLGGGYNRPASYAYIDQAGIQAAKIGLGNQKNLLGLKMAAKGNALLIGIKLEFDVGLLLNSSYYPSGASAAGDTGGAFAVNPIKGIAEPIISNFMFKNDGTVSGDSAAWYMLDKTKPFFVLQLRSAAEVTQEDPNSGESFDRDINRFKCSMRGNADFIDPRFIWQGNDGSDAT